MNPEAAPAAKSPYSRATREALIKIEQVWKGMEDSDRIILGDAIEAAIAEATLDANTEAKNDLETIVSTLAKYAK